MKALLQDHLGDTNQVVDVTGNAAQMRYGVWSLRSASGVLREGAAGDMAASLPTSQLYREAACKATGPLAILQRLLVRQRGGHLFRSGSRCRLDRKSLDDIVGIEANHVLPQEFAEKFKDAGINIHDASFGSWVGASAHRDWSYAYNQRWRVFLEEKRSAEEILDFARKLAKEYNFDVHFSNP